MKKPGPRQTPNVGAMTISLQFTHLTVHNPDAAIAFYRDALGLKVQNDVSNGDFRWVTMGTSTQPGLGIVLSEPHAGRSQEDGDAMARLLAKGVLPMLNFSASDLNATFEKAAAAGAEVLQEPVEQPWGPRDCAFRDPSGNTVRVAQA
ncbi:putative glyoxalase superfamily protein PhnB [Arthrobacter sp. UYCu511]